MNRVRKLWEAGRPAIVGWLHIPSSFSAEAMGRCGYDGLVVDLQHGPTELATAIDMFRAIEAGGAEPCVRLKQNDAGEIMKLLDMGASGLICPMVETADQAAVFADALHYPPKGSRSYGPRRPALRHGANYACIASETIFSMVMIETWKGIDNLDDILGVPGIDGVFIGPSDLALSLSCEPLVHSAQPLVVEAIDDILARARAAGRHAGIFCADSRIARERIDAGFDLVSLQPDLSMMVDAARAAIAAMGASG